MQGAAADKVPRPLGLLAELTHRCPLGCPYCSNPLALDAREGELDAATWARVFGEAFALGVLQVHLSGGEPASRRDLVDITAAAHAAGLYTNLITSGVGLAEPTLRRLAAAGLDHVQISIQDSEAASADQIAGYVGAFTRKQALAAQVVRLKLALTINMVVHRANIDRVGDMVPFALALGASRIEIAHVQYYGWALKNRDGADAEPRAGRARGRDRRGAAPGAPRQDRDRRRRARLLRALSKAVCRGLGTAVAQRHALGPGAAVSRGGGDPGSRILVRARPLAGGYLERIAGLSCVSRHRVDAGAVRQLRRVGTRISAAAAARRSCWRATPARPTPSVICRRIMRASPSSPPCKTRRRMSIGVRLQGPAISDQEVHNECRRLTPEA